MIEAEIKRLVQDALNVETRDIGNPWAGVGALAAGGAAAVMRLDAAICAVVIACTFATTFAVSEWLQIRRQKRRRIAAVRVREVLEGVVTEERDTLCLVLLERGGAERLLRDAENDDPVMWICAQPLRDNHTARDAVRCGQALRLIRSWRNLTLVAERTEKTRYDAAQVVLQAMAVENSERRRALETLSASWRGTFQELVLAVGLNR
jgi:hypothetical protein